MYLMHSLIIEYREVLCLQQSQDTSIPLNQGISTPRLKRLQRGKLKCEKQERRRSKGPTNIGRSLPSAKGGKMVRNS